MEEAINGMRPKSGGTPSAPAPQPSAHGARVFGAISQERFMSERVYGFEDEEVRSLVRLFPRKLSINTSQKKEGGRPTVIVSLTPDRQNRQYPQNSQPID